MLQFTRISTHIHIFVCSSNVRFKILSIHVYSVCELVHMKVVLLTVAGAAITVQSVARLTATGETAICVGAGLVTVVVSSHTLINICQEYQSQRG